MADRQLSNALSSGELTNIQLGGIGAGEKVLTQTEVLAISEGYVKEDGTSSIVRLNYIPQTEPVPFQEGGEYYSNDTGTFNLQGRYSDVSLQVGREQHVEVLNNSLVDIPNGTSIRYAGVAGNIPVVIPALADSFESSGGFGVSTHLIPSGQKGIVTTFGRVSGLNLSAFNDGDVLYLSDTIPGGFTIVPPDIATRIGIVFSNDALDGVLFANPDTNSTLPTIGAFYQNLSNTTPVDATKRIFGDPTVFPLGFTSVESLLIDVSSGYAFQVPSAGIYGGSFVISMSGIHPDANGHILGIGIDVNGIEQFKYNAIVNRNDSIMSASFGAKIVLSPNDIVTMTYVELSNNGFDNDGPITITGIQIAIESAQIR